MASISKAMRQFVYDRDLGICNECGKHVAISDASVDHVQPVSIGGTDSIDNYRLVHARCNSRKGKYLPTDPGKGPRRSTWTANGVISEIGRRRGRDIEAVASSIVDWARHERLEFEFPKSSASGGIYFNVRHPGGKACVFALWGDSSAWLHFIGRGRPSLSTVSQFASLESRILIVTNLREQVPGVAGIRSFQNPYETANKNPEIDLFFLISETSLRAFLNIYSGVLETIRGSTR